MERCAKRGEGLFWLALLAAGMGIVLICSATRYDPALHSLPGKQGAALGAGIGLCLGLARLDLESLTRRLWWLLAGGNIFLLLLLVPLGNDDGTGNRSWIALPGGLFNFQPAEVVKLTFLLLLALQVEVLRPRGLNRPGTVLALAAHGAGVCGLLVAVSGDVGMAGLCLAAYGAVLWAAGLHPLWLGAQIGCGVGGFFLLWSRLPGYIRTRFLVVLDHDLDPLGKGFQQGRSVLALGSGQVTGQGLFQGIQTQSHAASALPARHTDFIFAVAGEELGLVGCLVILALLGAIVLGCLRRAGQAEDPFARLVCAGAAGILAAQTALNVAMCLYAAPVVGVTLPFFSYGGSSLVTAFGAVGMVLSFRDRRPQGWVS